MKNEILLEYNLNEEMWRRFFDAHYQHQSFFRGRYVYGAILVTIGVLMLGAGTANPLVGAAFLLSGLYCVLSKQLFVLKSMATARKGPLFEGRVTVRLSREGMSVTSGSMHSERAWEDFRGYRLVPAGIMLYTDQNAFFFIPREALTEATEDILQRFLDYSELKRL